MVKLVVVVAALCKYTAVRAHTGWVYNAFTILRPIFIIHILLEARYYLKNYC